MFGHAQTHRYAELVWWLFLTTAVAVGTLIASSRVAGPSTLFENG